MTINSVTITDETYLEMLRREGFTQSDVNTLEKQLAYRKSYNTRPEVIAKRKLYTQKRNLKLKLLKSLLQQ